MKNLFLFSNLLRKLSAELRLSDVSPDRRLTIGSPLGFTANSLLKLVIVLTLAFSFGVGNAWGTTVDKKAEWSFTSTSYPSNNTNFNATGGDYSSGSYFEITNSSTGWNKNALKFTCSSSAPNFFIAIKTPAAIPSGTKITLKTTMWYNKANNKPLGSASISVSTNGGSSYNTTGLGTTKWTLSTSSADYSTVYTTQANIAANTVIVFKLAGADRSGAGEGYCQSPSITIPVESSSKKTCVLMDMPFRGYKILKINALSYIYKHRSFVPSISYPPSPYIYYVYIP